MEFTKERADAFIRENTQRVDPLWRPKFHLSGECGWINDPNGFVRYEGQYHLFYQHYPYEPKWGPMHWGHAVSPDLIAWRYLPIALAPDQPYDQGGCFSGSAIEADGRLCLLYTGHLPGYHMSAQVQTQCLAVSQDGLLFDKYPDNPVIKTEQVPQGTSSSDFRDPRVLRRSGVYYLLIGSEDLQGQGQLLLYRSKDLITWEFVNTVLRSDGTIGHRAWECPDLITLGNTDVLIFSPQGIAPRADGFHNASGSAYMIGHMDWERGIYEGSGPYPLDYGFDFYAPQCLIDDQGRAILTAWMDMWGSPMPIADMGHHWAGAMILPREVSLSGGRLIFSPVQGLEGYKKNEACINDCAVEGCYTLPITGCCSALDVRIHAGDSTHFGLKLRLGKDEETVLSYDVGLSRLTLDREKSGQGPGGRRSISLSLDQGVLALHILLDMSSIEVFAAGGQKVMTGRIYPKAASDAIEVFSNKRCRILHIQKWDIVNG